MTVSSQSVPVIVTTRRHGDARGWFAESYNARRLAEAGIDTIFVQDNHSYSAKPGTLRGLHFQTPPHAQVKLVRCLRGAIWDVLVDLRKGSPSYGQWVAAELSADNGDQLFVPAGFAHGFVTLAPDTEIAYKVSDFYAPSSDGGIAWDDPELGIDWPLDGLTPELSDKDRALPGLDAFDSPFAYDGKPLGALERLA
ncbi:MAG: dTDP-4-dehydrorhamnose 3,5-epimerase [Blastomonas sp.]